MFLGIGAASSSLILVNVWETVVAIDAYVDSSGSNLCSNEVRVVVRVIIDVFDFAGCIQSSEGGRVILRIVGAELL